MIRTFDDPVLKVVCSPIAPGEDLAALMDLMRRDCTRNKGAGLAAPQVGSTKRLIFTLCAGPKGVRGRFMVNPVIVQRSEETTVEREGCLSYPGVFKYIRRHNWVELQFETEQRIPQLEKFSGFHARVVQHECDHLDGICRVGDDRFPADLSKRQSRLATRAMLQTAIIAIGGVR